jgi:hypothetical protein
MATLAFAPRFTRWRAVVAVGLELVWANAHGSFPLGVLLLLAGALEQKPQRRERLVTAAAAAAVTLLNPYGLGLHRLVWRYLRGDDPIFSWIRGRIEEYGPLWHSLLLHTRLPAGLLLLLAASLWTLLKTELRVRAAFALGLLLLSILQVRDAQWVGPVGVLLLAPALMKLGWGGAPPPRLARAVVLSAAGLGLALGAIANLLQRRTLDSDAWYGWQSPMARLAEQLPDNAKVLVPFQASGLVLWLVAPRGGHLFFDARNDCYSASTARAYDELLEQRSPSPADLEEILNRDGVDQVIAPSAAKIAMTLSHDPDWTRTHTEGRLALFERRVLESR